MNDKLNTSLAKNFDTDLIAGGVTDLTEPTESKFYFTDARDTAASTMTHYQSVKFIEDFIAKNVNILQKITKLPVKAHTGKLPVLNITARNWRIAGSTGSKIDDKYVEGDYAKHHEGKIQGIFSEIPYTLTKLMADMTITHDFLRFNIEREGAETTILDMVAKRHAEDIADLMFCGGLSKDLTKTKDVSSIPFYNMSKGFIQKLHDALETLGLGEDKQIFNRYKDKEFTDDVFYQLVKSINDSDISIGKYVWLCHPSMKVLLMEHLKNRQTIAGDMAIIGKIGELTPLDIPFETVFCFPKDMIILCDPTDFTLAYYDEISFRKTDEGATLVQTDSRYYVWYYWLDFLVTAPRKMAMAYNINLDPKYTGWFDPDDGTAGEDQTGDNSPGGGANEPEQNSNSKAIQTQTLKSKNLPILST